MFCKNIKCKKEIADDFEFCPYCGRKQTVAERKRRKRPNGAGTVFKMQGNRANPWIAKKGGIYIGSYATQKEAFAKLESLADAPMNERFNFTFKQVYDHWKLEHFKDLKSDKGREGYENAYKHCKPLYDKRFRNIRTSDYQRIVDDLEALGRSHSTVNKIKQLAGQMSKWAMREEIITTNYAKFIKLADASTAEKKIFTDEEIATLKTSSSEAAKIVLLMIYTGMRIGELFTLETANCFDNYCIGGSKTEAGVDRLIPIPSIAKPYYDYFKDRSTGKLFLSGYEGNLDADNFRVREFYPLLETLGIERRTPHNCRHTYATLAVRAGVKPEYLQEAIGHASYSTTVDIYTHINKDEILKAFENFGK